MKVQKFALTDASLERSPGQDGDIFAANVIDQRHGGPITIGFGRYAPNQSSDEKLAVDDVMLVLEGQLSVEQRRQHRHGGCRRDRLHAEGRDGHHPLARAGCRHRLRHLPALAGGGRVKREPRPGPILRGAPAAGPQDEVSSLRPGA